MANAKSEKRIETKNIMIGCPEDVEKKFLDKIIESIQEFNEKQGWQFGIRLEAKHWRSKTYSAPENVQEAINKQLCDECDYLLAIFYCSPGSANASKYTGTLTEIKYFCTQKKQVFLHRYNGMASIDLSDAEELKRFKEYLDISVELRKKLYYKSFKNENDLKKVIIEDLTNFFKNISKRKNGNQAKRVRGSKKKDSNPIQDSMRECMRLYDDWVAIKTKGLKFSFYDKAKDLIAGMQADGSVQYYVGNSERFRTTPTASTLDALYLAKLLPDTVRYKMQDWVYNSRQDPCDAPDDRRPPEGYKPDSNDGPGWSWNEGVSVWATSKALGTLIMTGYYDRSDVFQNNEIMQTTYDALAWLADQEYEEGGWGFQYAPDKAACAPSVTMTALALKVITKFLMDSFKNGSPIKLDHDLEKKLSTAKRKGITYLLNTMKQDEELKYIYWEYDNEPSLTGTIWVLDFINMAQGQEARELYRRRREIVTFCVSRLPSCPREYEERHEEVYFVGGETKYKPIPSHHKFYAYLPYHIPVILQSGVKLNPNEDTRIEVCIYALIKGKESYWYGTDASDGSFQHPTCFARAMALSVVAFWMRKTSGELIADKLKGDWETEEYDQ